MKVKVLAPDTRQVPDTKFQPKLLITEPDELKLVSPQGYAPAPVIFALAKTN